MASSESNNSFEALIHADRARKKNEDLANTIFGRSKSSQNVKKNQSQTQKEIRSPSLASRMGVQKRHSSSGASGQKNPFNPPSRPSSTTPSNRGSQASFTRASRIASEIDSGNATISPSARNAPVKTMRNGTSQQAQPEAGPGLSIKGSAGPFTLHASNFAPGTTEADIESALHGDLFDSNGTNCLVSCNMVRSQPSVTFEMIFTEKSVADRIIKKFNNLKADGRILKLDYVKAAPNSADSSRRNTTAYTAVTQSIEPTAADDIVLNPVEGDMDMAEADVNTEYPTTSYDHDREAADRDRRDRDRDRDGLGSGNRRDDRREDRPREDRERRRDDRDREDRGERDRDRDRDRTRDRDRDYDRREVQAPVPQSYNADMEYSQRAANQTYGNNFNRPRGGSGFGGYNRGGYSYNRAGYAPSRGYRGGYSR